MSRWNRRGTRVASLLVGVALLMASAIVDPTPAGAVSDGVWDYRSTSISGTYKPLVGNFDLNASDDVLWYAPGTAPDAIWFGATRGSFTSKSLTINGTYQPILGDFGGDARTDVLWYRPGTGADTLWISSGAAGAFSSRSVTINGTFIPLVLDDLASGKDDIFWYAAGAAADALWRFDDGGSGSHTSVAQTVNGTFKPVVGRWNADASEDIFWYAAGSAPDSIWLATSTGQFTRKSVSVNGTYVPLTIYRDDITDGVHWNAAGTATDSMSVLSTASTLQPVNMTEAQIPVPCSLLKGTVGATIVYCSNDVDAIVVLEGLTATAFRLSDSRDMGPGYKPLVGDFDGDTFVDIFWYGPGTVPDQVWYTDTSTATASKSRPAPRLAGR